MSTYTRAEIAAEEAAMRHLDRAFHLPEICLHLKDLAVISPSQKRMICKTTHGHKTGCNGFLSKGKGQLFVDLILKARELIRQEGRLAEIDGTFWDTCGVLFCGDGHNREIEMRRLFAIISKRVDKDFPEWRVHAMDWEPTTLTMNAEWSSRTKSWMKR